MDLTVFPLYADGSTGDALVEVKLSEYPPHAAHELGAHILDAARRAPDTARHAMGPRPVALDITLTLDAPELPPHSPECRGIGAGASTRDLERCERCRRDQTGSPLPDPPEELRDAWARFREGGDVSQSELRKLDEWRAECAEAAGF